MSKTVSYYECSVIPIPRMHTALGNIPHATSLATDCLPQDCPAQDCPPWSAPLVNLPLSPAQVRACRADLASLDPDELARAVQMAAAERLRATFSGDENAALQSFTNKFSAAPSPESTNADAKRRHAQYMLLLVWAQEERLLEISSLTQQCAASEEKLRLILGEGMTKDLDESLGQYLDEDLGEIMAEMTATPDQDLLALLPPWAFVLEHMQHFLPDNAVLLINDPALAALIRKVGTVKNDHYQVRAAQLSTSFAASDKEYCCILPPHTHRVQANPEDKNS